METSAIISLIVFGILIWGGSIVTVIFAVNKERDKNKLGE